MPGYANAPYGAAPMPPELESVRSLLNVSRILAIVFGILTFIGFLGELSFALLVAPVFGPGAYESAAYLLISAAVLALTWISLGEVIREVEGGQYEMAKSKLLLWMVLGFPFGWLIIGILLLVAYLKFDTLIAWHRQYGRGTVPPTTPYAYAPAPVSAPAPSTYASPPSAGTPPPSYAPAPAAPIPTPGAYPVPAPVAPMAACPRCGRPATWIAQYNRWFCYFDQQYV
ncbi:MAG TPA: hypothetical protein VGV64_06335 [Thermoplasmata archaeon]|nr:hypothetical protein [Thermoplasmata archaeon]